MTIQNETIRNVDFIALMRDTIMSTDEVPVTNASTTLPIVAGTVMGKITSSGIYVPYNQDASDGSENAAGILYAKVDASSTAVPSTVVTRNCAVVSAHLTWPSDITANEKTAAEAQLVALNIIPR